VLTIENEKGITMPQSKVWVQVSESKQYFPTQIHIHMQEQLLKRLRIPIIEPVLLRFGSIQKVVRFMDTPSSNKEGQSLTITANLAHELGLSTGDTIRIRYHPDHNEVRLGPVLGILTAQTYEKQPQGLFGINSSFFEEVAQASRQSGTFVYIFTLDGVDLQNKHVTGWRYKNKRWAFTRFPLPDVIHNRLDSRKMELSETIQTFFANIKHHTNIPIFNHRFLNKVEVTQLLSNDSRISSLSPETVTHFNKSLIAAMFKKYPVIFVKPSKGSLGYGIIHFTRTAKGWKCIQNSMTGPVHRHFHKPEELLKFLYPRLRKASYLIQRGIPLVHVMGSPVDFRALLQKNGMGKWSITSTVARIASEQSFVSNVAQGGKLSRVKAALQNSTLPDHLIPAVERQLKNAALAVAETIEERADGLFAELGIDLGVDASGKVWLIEVNSKPSKTEDASMNDGKIRPSVRKMLDYVQYLAKFTSKD
jgi:glutathione synthase/RimK-type ligase-like ATP-grasp enzyme